MQKHLCCCSLTVTDLGIVMAMITQKITPLVALSLHEALLLICAYGPLTTSLLLI